jgi:succinate-semialdehyde dehydrogenase / glutarate-semialdehyde dehydrogenase
MSDLLDFLPQPVRSRLFLNGQPTFEVINPATGKPITEVTDCGVEDAKRAADRSVSAFESYRKTTPFERSGLLRRWFNLIIEHTEPIARLMSMEMGKPITESRGEVRYAAGFVEWYAEEAKRVYGDVVPHHAADKRLFVIKQPVGPVFAITPWNFPAAMVTRKAAPALAAGCTFILKPAEQCPLTSIYLAYLWEEAGGAPEVFQVLTTSNPKILSQALIEDARIRKLTFTGSTEVGKVLYSQSAATMKRISLELGGHAPFLIFEDADIALAVKETVASKFRNAGQTCVCANRIFVHERIAEAFSAELTTAVAKLRVGDPLDDNTQIGPLIDRHGLEKVQAHVEDAVSKGARIATGGKVDHDLFYQPTVLTQVRAGMVILEEETFGPVAPVITFSSDTEAIRMANDTPYGLAAYLYTDNLSRAIRVAEALDYGIIGLNDGLPSASQAPFGGIKESGIGREGGKWGIEEYLNIKYISLSLLEQNNSENR